MNVEHWERQSGKESQKSADQRKLWAKIRTEEGEIMVCNVYMPCEGGPISKQKHYSDILADIKEDIKEIKIKVFHSSYLETLMHTWGMMKKRE